MGLLTGIISLPLAPIRGVAWIAERLAEQAEQELYDEPSILRLLDEARDDHEQGRISDETFRAQEDELLSRLIAARTRRRSP